MTLSREELNIASDFSTMPGPRKRTEAQFSGQEFLEDHLRPKFLLASAHGVKLHINLDGAAGYPTSFLEEAFGGLSREFGAGAVFETIELTCLDEPYLADDIHRYIKDAAKYA